MQGVALLLFGYEVTRCVKKGCKCEKHFIREPDLVAGSFYLRKFSDGIALVLRLSPSFHEYFSFIYTYMLYVILHAHVL